jgi:hypothetical protein
MTLPEALDLFDYWDECPPENEMLAMLARVYTTWQPKSAKTKTAEQIQDEHRKSLEARWKGGAMNPKQMFEAMGGALSLNGVPGQRMTGANMPGIGPFPGAPRNG